MPKSGDKMAKRSLFATARQDFVLKSSLLANAIKDSDTVSQNEFPMMSNNLVTDIMTNLNRIRKMIADKCDIYAILEKIVNEMSENYEKCLHIIKKNDDSSVTRSNSFNDQLASLEKDMISKINCVQKESDNNSDKIDVKLKCKDEVNFVWLTFTDPAEMDNLMTKNKSELFCETKKIFGRMNIKLDKPHKTIIDVMIRKVSVKTNGCYGNESILGIKFTNSSVASYLKRRITEYGKNAYINEEYDLIRYSVRNYWSFKVWKLLRVCNDLKNFNLIENANVTEHGIAVKYNKPTRQAVDHSQRMQMKLITNENDLNNLRYEVGDTCKDISAFQFYNGDYLKLELSERKAFKENVQSVVSNNDNSQFSSSKFDKKFRENVSPTSTSISSNLINRCASSSKKI